LERWLSEQHGAARGAVLALDLVWRLSRVWYPDPRDASWRPRTRDESQALLASLGLMDPFWEMPR